VGLGSFLRSVSTIIVRRRDRYRIVALLQTPPQILCARRVHVREDWKRREIERAKFSAKALLAARSARSPQSQ
jgi:hypothetical protein